MIATRSNRTVMTLALCAGTSLPAMHASGIDPLAGAAPVISARNYVGMGQSEFSRTGVASCTETHLGNGVIMTASHCIGFTPGNPRYMSVSRVELTGRQYMAASITHPNYGGNVNFGANDIALRYIINGQTANAAPANILASVADEANIIARINPPMGAATPVDVRIVGWQSGDGVTNANLLEGITRPFRGDAGAPIGFGRGYRAGEWLHDRSEAAVAGGYTGSNGFFQGDSGGPSFAMVNGVERLIGVHSFRTANAGVAAGMDVDTRISPYLDFIAGRGVSPGGGAANAGVWNRWSTLPGTGGWNAANWSRQSTPLTNAIPLDGDFVILDPTAGADSGAYTVQLNFADSANLMGLANDLRLEVSNGKALRVTGQTGIVSSGMILASGAGTRVISSTQIDNGGILRAREGALIQAGFGLPGADTIAYPAPTGNTLQPTKSVLNTTTGSIELQAGGRMEVNSQLDNRGIIRIGSDAAGQPSVLEAGAGLPPAVGPVAALDGFPVALNNDRVNDVDPAGNARIFVDAGGRIAITNGASHTALFLNGTRGEITVAGNGTRTGTITTDVAFNYGTTNIRAGGEFTSRNLYFNGPGGRLNVSGDGVSGDGNFTGAIINSTNIVGPPVFASGLIEIGSRGTVNARTATENPGLALDNRAEARINIAGRGNLFVTGNAENRGTITLNRTDTAISQYNGQSNPVAGGDFTTTNFGRITFAGTAATRPAINLTSHDFVNETTGVVTGTGLFVMGGSADWTSRAATGAVPANASNFNGLNMLWDGAGTSTDMVNMEALSRDAGQVLAGLAFQFAFNSLCFANSSNVSIGDLTANDGGGVEVIYTRFLGISSDSRVDLNGHTLYYLAADPNCTLDLSRFYDGTVAQIPTPSAVVLLSLAGVFASRRRRAVVGC